MQETIDYARSLKLDMLKFGITIGFPGTRMFNEYARDRLVRSFDWDKYYVYTDEPLFAHRHLEYETVLRYMNKAYRDAILTNPGFILRQLWWGIRTGQLFWDVYYFLKFMILPAYSHDDSQNAYYAPGRWPRHDFVVHLPSAVEYPKATYGKHSHS
jgi:hypothetical protein